MLYYSAVKSATLELLRKLMNLPELSDFSLAGGTALALRYGHRISVDLDLFSSVDFDSDIIINALSKEFSGLEIHSTNNIGIFCYIDDVKVDFVKYHYFPIIAPIEKGNGIRILSDCDLIAMKVNALHQNGYPIATYIAELLQKFRLKKTKRSPSSLAGSYTRVPPSNRRIRKVKSKRKPTPVPTAISL